VALDDDGVKGTDALSVALTVEQLWQPVPGGSGTYVRELAAALIERGDVHLIGVSGRHGSEPAAPWQLPADLEVAASRLPRAALYEAWTRLRRPRPWGAGRRPEVVHATTWAVPPAGDALVVTVHDLAFLREPAHFTPRGNAFFRRALDVVRREASAVIAVSATTRDDCVAAGLPPERVHVIPHGVAIPQISPQHVTALRQRLGLHRPYVLWCGTLEPRKNVAGLARAYARLLREQDVDLVLAGPTGWGDHREVDTALRDVPTDRVHRVGALSWTDLHATYAGAAVFCFPSFWEGFGMPVLEAMAHGVPVVTSAETSMAEIGAAGGAVLVDPHDPASIKAGLAAALASPADALAERGKRHAAQFTWARCADDTVAVYRTALASLP